MRVKYLVVQPSFNWSQPGAYQSGTVISRHRSIGAAQTAIDRAVRKLRKQAGMAQSWYDWHICAEEGDSRRRLTAMEQGTLADLGGMG